MLSLLISLILFFASSLYTISEILFSELKNYTFSTFGWSIALVISSLLPVISRLKYYDFIYLIFFLAFCKSNPMHSTLRLEWGKMSYSSNYDTSFEFIKVKLKRKLSSFSYWIISNTFYYYIFYSFYKILLSRIISKHILRSGYYKKLDYWFLSWSMINCLVACLISILGFKMAWRFYALNCFKLILIPLYYLESRINKLPKIFLNFYILDLLLSSISAEKAYLIVLTA